MRLLDLLALLRPFAAVTMSAQSSHRPSHADEERSYRPSSSSHTSHSLKSSPKDNPSRTHSHTQSHSAKDRTATHQSPARSTSPSRSLLRTFSSSASASASPLRTSSLPWTTTLPPGQPHPSATAAAASGPSHPLLSDTELHDLLAAFQAFDRDGTGRVPTNSILATLRCLPPHPSHALLSSLLSSPNDRSHGGTVTFDEFVALLTGGGVGGGSGGEAAGRVEWERVFALMDEGGKGWLDESDMERVRRTVAGGKGSSGSSRADVRAMLARADLNGDGVVSKDEFVALMMDSAVL